MFGFKYFHEEGMPYSFICKYVNCNYWQFLFELLLCLGKENRAEESLDAATMDITMYVLWLNYEIFSHQTYNCLDLELFISMNLIYFFKVLYLLRISSWSWKLVCCLLKFDYTDKTDFSYHQILTDIHSHEAVSLNIHQASELTW